MNNSTKILIKVIVGEIEEKLDTVNSPRYCAHCLDFDLLGYGDTQGDALSELFSCISAYRETKVDSMVMIEDCPISQKEASRGLRNIELIKLPILGMENEVGRISKESSGLDWGRIFVAVSVFAVVWAILALVFDFFNFA